MALCSVSDVESMVQIDYSSDLETDITNVFIPYVDSAIKRFLGYDPEYDSSIVEKFDGREKTHLFLTVCRKLKKIISIFGNIFVA